MVMSKMVEGVPNFSSIKIVAKPQPMIFGCWRKSTTQVIEMENQDALSVWTNNFIIDSILKKN